MNSIECVKFTSVEHHNGDFTQIDLSHVLWTYLKKFFAYIEAIFFFFFFLFPSINLSICLPIVNIEKNNGIEKYFKNMLKNDVFRTFR